MDLLTKQQCFDIWEKYQMPDNIKKHSRKVTEVADSIAIYIEEQNVKVNKDLVNRGALLHDVAKIVSINEGEEHKHAVRGAGIAEDENLGKEIAEIIRKHYLPTFNDQCTIEELIVNYADKRVIQDRVVSLEDRFEYIQKSYPSVTEELKIHGDKYLDFEKKYKLRQLDLK